MRLISHWIICLELSLSARLQMTYREAELDTSLKGWDWEGRITDAIFNHKNREMLAVYDPRPGTTWVMDLHTGVNVVRATRVRVLLKLQPPKDSVLDRDGGGAYALPAAGRQRATGKAFAPRCPV